jgi:murein lipoprotein
LEDAQNELSPHDTNVSADIVCQTRDSALTEPIHVWKGEFMRSNFPKYPTVALILIGAVGLSGCATKGFVREQIATVNTRIDGMDGRLRTVEGTSGQALAQAQAAAGQSQQNGQRIDQINSRVDGLDQQMQQQAKQRQRKPRG